MAVTGREDKDYAAEVAQLSQQNTYIPSENVTSAQAELSQVASGKPAEYTNENAEQLGGLYDSIINRSAYSYDPSKDSAYQDYRQKYMAYGKQAAKDTVSNSRNMAGGYGDTWSNAAANQQYGEYLKGMDDALPQFEQNAYGKYNAEGNVLGAKLNAAVEKDSTDYERWSDQYSNWANDRAYAANRAQQAFANDYQQYSDNMSNALTMIGYGREDQEIVRSNAYSMATSLLKNGIMPIDTLLEQAGIGQADALNYAVKNGYKVPGSGGHGGRKKRTGRAKAKDELWFIAGERKDTQNRRRR